MADDREYVETAKMESFGYTVPDGSEDYKKGFQDGVDFVLDRFYDLPREDVAPVIHAHWKHVGTAAGVGMVYHCSHCERQVIVDYAFMLSQYPYCHCGAKMGKEQEQCGG